MTKICLKALLICVVLLLIPAYACSQIDSLSPKFPVVYVDSENLANLPHRTAEFPIKIWEAAADCMEHAGVSILPILRQLLSPPALVVVSNATALVVRDSWLQRLVNYEPSDGILVSPLSYAYSLIGTNSIVVIERLATNPVVLRHEALHFWVWYTMQRVGHPKEVFAAC